MAIAKNEIQVEWLGADSKSIAATGNATSDTVTLSAECISFSVFAKADNDGTPASGDEVDFKVLRSIGDPDVDPDSADEFETNGHTPVVITLDTNSEDPAKKQVDGFSGATKTLQIYAENQSAGRAITVSVQIRELLG